MNRRRRRHGYVLVMTLALLVLGASLTVAVGRASLRHAVHARLAADELQHRWGTVSCRNALLPHAEAALGVAEAGRGGPVALVETKVTLGNETFDLTITDELAKANVNALLDRTDLDVAESRLRQALAGTGAGVGVRLRPAAMPLTARAAQPRAATQSTSTTQPIDVPIWVGSFGQIFDDASPEKLLGLRGGARVAEILTCWGTGEINLRRASPRALKIAAPGLSMIEVNRLIEARDAVFSGKPPAPGATQPTDTDPVRRCLQIAGINVRTAKDLPRFTATSAVHSLWIVSTDGRRTWYSLTVRDESDPDHVRAAGCEW